MLSHDNVLLYDAGIEGKAGGGFGRVRPTPSLLASISDHGTDAPNFQASLVLSRRADWGQKARPRVVLGGACRRSQAVSVVRA